MSSKSKTRIPKISRVRTHSFSETSLISRISSSTKSCLLNEKYKSGPYHHLRFGFISTFWRSRIIFWRFCKQSASIMLSNFHLYYWNPIRWGLQALPTYCTQYKYISSTMLWVTSFTGAEKAHEKSVRRGAFWRRIIAGKCALVVFRDYFRCGY